MLETVESKMNTDGKFEEYAKKLYHYLKTEQDITFERHIKNPEITGLMFRVEKKPGKRDVFHYSYIGVDENFIIKDRKV